jgi:hypothetical protein
MEMHLLHEHLARVKQHEFQRELARDALLRELRGNVRARRDMRRRLAAALLMLADRLDPALPAENPGAAPAPICAA